MNSFYLLEANGVIGPFDEADIREMLEKRRID
jgi:hypothetical protein